MDQCIVINVCRASFEADQHEDGVSLLLLLKGRKLAQRSLIWHYPHNGNQGGDPSSILHRGDWKLIHYYEDDHNELYNLKTDWSETKDVSAENPTIVRQSYADLFDYLEKVNAKFLEKDPLYSGE